MTSHLNPDGTVREPDHNDEQPSIHHDPAAINACTLCDADGYIGSRVCDHTDHRPAARRGMDAIRRQMGWQ